MPAMPTLNDVIRAHNPQAVAGMIELATKKLPEITDMPFDVITGSRYLQPIRTSIPKVGLRSVNEGTPIVKCTYAMRMVETFMIDAPFEIDEETAKEDPKGPMEFISDNLAGILQAAFESAGLCFYYGKLAPGVPNAAKSGMPGLIDFVHADMIVDLGGTKNTTSAWMVCASNEQKMPTIHNVFGDGGKFAARPAEFTTLYDKKGDTYDGYRARVKGKFGIHAPAPEEALIWIRGISDEKDANLTDKVFMAVQERLPSKVTPTHIFYNKRGERMLREYRDSRALNAGAQLALRPKDHDGIPLYVTDSILNGEEKFLEAYFKAKKAA